MDFLQRDSPPDIIPNDVDGSRLLLDLTNNVNSWIVIAT